MARPNAIVLGAIVLGPAIVVTEGYAIYRTRHRPPRSSAESAAPVAPFAEAPAPAALAPEEPPAAPPSRHASCRR